MRGATRGVIVRVWPAAVLSLACLAFAAAPASAAKKGQIAIKVKASGEAEVICAADARRPDEVSPNLKRTPIGRCAKVKGKRIVLKKLKPARVILKSFGELGEGPCYSRRRSKRCKTLKVKRGGTTRVRWRIPSMVQAKPRRLTTEVAGGAVKRVSGDPSRTQSIVLKKKAGKPKVGTAIVIPVSRRAPEGLVGTVTAVRRKKRGKTLVEAAPATLGEAYKDLEIHIETPLRYLGEENQGSARPLASCNLSRTDVSIDLSELNFRFDLSLTQRSVEFLVSGSPALQARLQWGGSVDCELLTDAPGFPIPAGPILFTLKPTASFSAEGGSGLNLNWTPSIEMGFTHRPGSHVDVFDLDAGDANVEFVGAEVEAGLLIGGKLEGKVGGRVGLSGRFGPKAVAGVRATSDASRTCVFLDGLLYSDLKFEADLWLTKWAVTLAKGEFSRRPLFEECAELKERIAFNDSGGISVIGPDGEGRTQVLASSQVPGPVQDLAISRDGSRLAFVAGMPGYPGDCSGHDLYTVRSDGTGLTKVSSCGVSPALSDNGSRLVYLVGRQLPGPPPPPTYQDIYSVPAGGGSERRVVDLGDVMVTEPEIDDPECTWCPPYARFPDESEDGASPAGGALAAVYSGSSVVFTAIGKTPTGGFVVCPKDQPGPDADPEDPPPPKNCPEPPYGDSDLYQVDGDEAENLTHYGPGVGPQAHLVTDAAGGEILFAGSEGKEVGHSAYLIGSAGGDTTRIRPPGFQGINSPDLAPDGDGIVFEGTRSDGESGIWILEGGGPRLLVPGGRSPAWGG